MIDKKISNEFQNDGVVLLKNIIDHLKRIYCDSIGIEYMYIRDPNKVKWIQNHINVNGNHPNFSKDEKFFFRLLMLFYRLRVFLDPKSSARRDDARSLKSRNSFPPRAPR